MMTRTALVCLGPGAAGAFESIGKRRDEIQRLTRSRSLSRPRQSIRLMCVAPKDTGCGSCRCLAQARKGTRNYVWTLFRPGAAALSDLAQLVEQQRLSLPIAIRKPLDQADEAFEHIKKGRPGRALLTP